MEREELRKGTKRKECEKEQAGAEMTWKELIGRDPTEADWTPLLDGGQGKNICFACEPAAKKDRVGVDSGRQGEGPMGGISPGVGQVEGAGTGETMGEGQVEGPMGGHLLGVGLVEGLVKGEKLGVGRADGASKGETEGAGPADGSMEGDSEGVGQMKATRRRRRLRQHQRRARQLRDQQRQEHQGAPENQPRLTKTGESQKLRVSSGLDKQGEWPGLLPPTLADGSRVNGDNKRQLKRENKSKRIEKQINQEPVSHWTTYEGQFKMPPEIEGIDEWEGQMCPSGLALHHPAAATLLEYATGGCPTNTGNPWTKQQMQEAVDRGPHVSALDPEAIVQMEEEVADKVRIGQARLVSWDDIKENPPPELKISPLAMIPHKSRRFQAILDLSFRLRLECGDMLKSVNESTTLSAPAGAIDQLGHTLQRVIHAMAEADLRGDEKVFMAKYDIKDGFWRLNCQKGEEWNFAYVLPQEEGKPVKLVVPTSLQMGWVESPPYFGAASETVRDVASQYVELPVGALKDNKFVEHALGGEECKKLPDTVACNKGFRYFMGVYVDDFIQMAIARCTIGTAATTRSQCSNVWNT
jgi:hypothetical protein